MKFFATKSIETVEYCQEYFDILFAEYYGRSELRALFVCSVIIVSIWFDLFTAYCCLPCSFGE